MEQELIRKAADAIARAEFGIPEGTPISEEMSRQLSPMRERLTLWAEAALKVFYEHTRGQTREGHGVRCPDCGAAMHPNTKGSLENRNFWECADCGKTV